MDGAGERAAELKLALPFGSGEKMVVESLEITFLEPPRQRIIDQVIFRGFQEIVSIFVRHQPELDLFLLRERESTQQVSS